MKTPFSFELQDGIQLLTHIIKRRPGSKHHIVYAITRLSSSRPVKILRQSFSGFTFYLELITYFVKTPSTIRIKIAQSSMVFLYVLKEDLIFSAKTAGRPIIIYKGQCFAHAIPAGSYHWTVKPGKKKFVYFVLKPAWLLKMREVYPILAAVMQEMAAGNPLHTILPPFSISRSAARQLNTLRYVKASDKITQEEKLFHIINNLVAEYHQHLTAPVKIPSTSYKQIACEARDLIIEQVNKAMIPNAREIADHFNIETKLLRRNCYKMFKMNIHELVLDAQMKRAYSLLKKGMKIKEVAANLGYSEQANFTRSFKSYFGCPPSSFQK